MSGTCIKDTWTKPKQGRIKGGKWGWLQWWEVVGAKWRQLYLNNNKKNVKKKPLYRNMLHSEQKLGKFLITKKRFNKGKASISK